MRDSIILEIFRGNKGNIESMGTPKNNDKTLTAACAAYDKLKEKLSPELLSLHQAFVDASEENWLDLIDFYFIEGFKLGLSLGIECTEK